MTCELYDVIVIGGGPGGYTAAAKVSALGGKVALRLAHNNLNSLAFGLLFRNTYAC